MDHSVRRKIACFSMLLGDTDSTMFDVQWVEVHLEATFAKNKLSYEILRFVNVLLFMG